MQCYICHKHLTQENTHPNYKRMCKSCGEINAYKREELANLYGYTALVTGGRIKIGYETALKLLRSGAFVVVTTRFPVDAVQKYSQEADFFNWYKRLRIFQIDFRQLQSLFELVQYIEDELKHLDILINNAAQTVRHSYSYYQKLFALEHANYKILPEDLKSLIVSSYPREGFAHLQQTLDILLPITLPKPEESYGVNQLANQTCKELAPNCINEIQFDKNSWTSKACDISLVEMLEVQLINVTAPFFLCTSVRHLMQASPYKYKYIVNVSAMEGKFNKLNKNSFHPHTNMAKASLNMFTRTSAQEFANDGILMNSVDTGWITDENPDWLRKRNEKRGLIPPLDAKDGASRLCDPIFSSVNTGHHEYGNFLKDYERTEW